MTTTKIKTVRKNSGEQLNKAAMFKPALQKKKKSNAIEVADFKILSR